MYVLSPLSKSSMRGFGNSLSSDEDENVVPTNKFGGDVEVQSCGRGARGTDGAEIDTELDATEGAVTEGLLTLQ
jgi:hypothetical protein